MRYNNPYAKKVIEARYCFADKHLPSLGRILDIGCDDGTGLAVLKTGARQLEALDIRPKSSTLHGIPVRCADVTKDIVGLRSYNGIVMLEVLEHLPIQCHDHVIAELARSIRPDGTCVISTPNKGVIPYVSPEHISEIPSGEFQALVGRYFRDVEFFTEGAFTSSLTKSLLRTFRTIMCELGVYPFIHFMTPSFLLNLFSTKLRGEPTIVPLEELKPGQEPFLVIAVARSPKV